MTKAIAYKYWSNWPRALRVVCAATVESRGSCWSIVISDPCHRLLSDGCGGASVIWLRVWASMPVRPSALGHECRRRMSGKNETPPLGVPEGACDARSSGGDRGLASRWWGLWTFLRAGPSAFGH